MAPPLPESPTSGLQNQRMASPLSQPVCGPGSPQPQQGNTDPKCPPSALNDNRTHRTVLFCFLFTTKVVIEFELGDLIKLWRDVLLLYLHPSPQIFPFPGKLS